MEEPPGEEEHAGVVSDDAERVEPHDDDLEREPHEHRPPPAEPVRERSDERARDDAHRAVRRQDGADEGEREAEPQADDGEDGEGDAAGHPGEERAWNERHRERPRRGRARRVRRLRHGKSRSVRRTLAEDAPHRFACHVNCISVALTGATDDRSAFAFSSSTMLIRRDESDV